MTAEKRNADVNIQRLTQRIDKLNGLLDVSKAMTVEKDLDCLLEIIVSEAARVVDADRMTLWLVDSDGEHLWTKVAQGMEGGDRITIPIGRGIAGSVAENGEIINIPEAYKDDRFNPEVDKETGYKTHHILAVPMRYTTGEVKGVLQALNKQGGDCFDADDEELLTALGSNAAGAIENRRLYENIDKLFEGFVGAAVNAIESRDPTTSGHSERVADLTVDMGKKIERVDVGPYASLVFTQDDLREVRYAALLHDFGKVGVREHILTKPKKLFGPEIELIESRFRLRYAEQENLRLKEALAALQNGRDSHLNLADIGFNERKELEEIIEFIRRCNMPFVLNDELQGREVMLKRLDGLITDPKTNGVMTDYEVERLSIPIGSLDDDERKEIQSHVTHTFNFLQLIPWTNNLKMVPELAFGHHERLDGKGYPRALPAESIPPQTRMMSIADTYDALTARDRPYKPSVPHAKAIDILVFEGNRNKLDAELVKLFIDAKIHEILGYDDS
jgi:HD-GYP domain-containing protein (c-di-GMP phosphodiesterase class II)